MHQVATAGLEPDSIAEPLRRIFKHAHNFYFRMAKVDRIDPEKNKIATTQGDLYYDYLVIANGSTTNYFGNNELHINSFPLKHITHALDLRSQLLQNFEKAVLENNKAKRAAFQDMVIVGGGPTGVEVAGALAELKKHVLPQDYPELDTQNMGIYLIEGAPQLLGGMSSKASRKSLKYLQDLGVQVVLNKFVKHYDGEKVILDDETTLFSNLLIWAAGVKGDIIKGLSQSAVQHDRIVVDTYNCVQGYKNVFAIGDVALMASKKYPKGHPMLAPVAIQQGKLLAKNLIRIITKKKTKPFKYLYKGAMATVGRNKAVVDLPGRIRFGGFLAWLIWMFVHLFSLIGFRNKLVIFMSWIWEYITYDRGTRLIIRPYLRLKYKKIKKNTV